MPAHGAPLSGISQELVTLTLMALLPTAALPVRPANTAFTEAITHFARSIGAARSGSAAPATADIARLAELSDKLREAKDAYGAEQVDIQQSVAVAWQMFGAGLKEEAVRLLSAAADAEEPCPRGCGCRRPRQSEGVLHEAAQSRQGIGHGTPGAAAGKDVPQIVDP